MNGLSWLSRWAGSWLPGLMLYGGCAGTAAAMPAAAPAPRAGVVCNADLQHPIRVHVDALDPVRRGGTVRLRLTSSSRTDLTKTEARIVSAGGAAVIGRTRATLGSLNAGRESSTEFQVRLPSDGRRFLVEFRVEGEGTAGRIGRGAAINLLPDGPTLPARIATGADGRPVAEYPARRMP